VLNRDASIPITFVAFDVLRIDGKNMMDASFEERRAALVRLPLRPPVSVVAETFTDGAALFDAVCRLGLEGVVAKRLSSRYRANQRGWIKTKNPSYWCRDSERDAMQRSRASAANSRLERSASGQSEHTSTKNKDTAAVIVAAQARVVM
jgi:ATP-dependent DNA ligase